MESYFSLASSNLIEKQKTFPYKKLIIINE